MTEVGALYLRLAGRGLRVVDTRCGGKWARLAGRGRCTASRPECKAGRNGSVSMPRGVLVCNHSRKINFL